MLEGRKTTNALLLVIAACLVLLVLNVYDVDMVNTAEAVTDRGDQVVKVQLVSIDESPSLRWEEIPIEGSVDCN